MNPALNFRAVWCLTILCVTVLGVLLSTGCKQRVPAESPTAVTLAYVGNYRGFHRPCG